MKHALILAACLSAIATGATAEIYRWVDENGKTHYSDSKPESQKAETVDTDTNANSYSHQAVDYESFYQRPEQPTRPTLVMYATEWCGYCKKAREYFQANQIPYREYDVEKSAAAKRRFKQLGGTGYPLLVMGDQKMQGFSAGGFKSFYAKATQ